MDRRAAPRPAWIAEQAQERTRDIAPILTATSGRENARARQRQFGQRGGLAPLQIHLGEHKIVPSRFSRDRSALVLDMGVLGGGVPHLRPFQTIDLAKTGDSEKRQILAEYALVAGSSRAAAPRGRRARRRVASVDVPLPRDADGL